MLRPGLALVALPWLLAGCGRRVTFLNATPAAPLPITGSLARPEGPFPAVVLFHGCHGVSPQLHRWARWLTARGYVALVVDSFGPRNVPGDCAPEGPRDPPTTARLDDAFGPLRYLQAQPYVAADRIAALGFSQGGVYAMAVINGPSIERARRRGVDLPAVGFAASVAVYPGGCRSLRDELVVRPLLVLIGAADDWTPPGPCEEMVARMRARGAEASIVLYPGAYHYFDVEGQPLAYLAEVGTDGKPGGPGATVWYQAEAAADAQRRIESFLARHLGRRGGRSPARASEAARDPLRGPAPRC